MIINKQLSKNYLQKQSTYMQNAQYTITRNTSRKIFSIQIFQKVPTNIFFLHLPFLTMSKIQRKYFIIYQENTNISNMIWIGINIPSSILHFRLPVFNSSFTMKTLKSTFISFTSEDIYTEFLWPMSQLVACFSQQTENQHHLIHAYCDHWSLSIQ